MDRRGFFVSLGAAFVAPFLQPFLRKNAPVPQQEPEQVLLMREFAHDFADWSERYRHLTPDPGYSHSLYPCNGNLPICPPGWYPCQGNNVSISPYRNSMGTVSAAVAAAAISR